MAAQKRSLDNAPSSHKSKKLKASTLASEKPQNAPPTTSTLTTDDIDFPRGGGTSYTPLEVKTIRAEALKEADRELFKVCFIHSSRQAIAYAVVGGARRIQEIQEAEEKVRSWPIHQRIQYWKK